MATNITSNKDVDYIQRDFNSVVDALTSFATVQYGPGTSANRLWSSFNLDSFSRNWLELVAYISDSFYFYFDQQATQNYLQTATVQSAVNNIAKQFGFSPATATSASGNATFTVTSSVTIPRGFKVKASNGMPFYVTNNIVAPVAGDYTGLVLQGLIKTEQFTSVGLQNEEFTLTGPNVIKDLTNLNSGDISPQVTVNGNVYTYVTSFIKNNGTDTAAVLDALGNVINGGRVFEIGQRDDGTPFLRFGDGVFGRKLIASEVVSITYRTGGGSAGNIGQQTLTTLVDTLPQVTAVTNNAQFSGGADQQTIDQLRDLIPASLRTLDRAVAIQDYADLLTTTFTEVFAASAAKNDQPGVDLNVYVVPQGVGITKISDNTLLKSTLFNFLDRRKTVTTQFQILDAYGVQTLLTLEVFINNTASKSNVKQSILAALNSYFSLTTGGSDNSGISFAEVILTENITSLIKTIPGIDRFEIKKFSYRPRIANKVIGLLTTYNDSNVSIFPNVENLEWQLCASGIANNSTGTVLFNNSGSVAYTYVSGTGLITFASNIDLSKVSPGDQFRDGASTDFAIFAVDTKAHTLLIPTGQSVNLTPAPGVGGSIRIGATTFESFKAFKKILATTTNLAIDSITDNNLDLSVIFGTGSVVDNIILLDNSQIFIPNQYADGNHYLVDAVSNIWEIVENTSDYIKTGTTAVNDASVTIVTSGNYSVVKKLNGYQVLFNSNIFNIQYNTANTVFSIGGEFSQIGTIGDPFAISRVQTNIGHLGVALNLATFNSMTKVVTLASTPSLNGISSDHYLTDKTGQIFPITAINNVIGSKSIIIDSNLVPVLGAGASISKRYFDDENQISLMLGISNSVITSATDVNALGKGTVGGNPNRDTDSFTFRTSGYNDDIVNLRTNEIPQISDSDTIINIFGGVA